MRHVTATSSRLASYFRIARNWYSLVLAIRHS
jgi:hypothetical protein